MKMNYMAAPSADITKKTAREVAARLSEEIGVSIEDVRSPSRKRPIPDARKIISIIMRQQGYTLYQTADAINRDHASIHVASKEGKDLIKHNRAFRETYQLLLSKYNVI